MKGKLLFVAGGVIGYVLGARAGRRRYEQIVEAAGRVWQSKPVQKQVSQVEQYASKKLQGVPEGVANLTKKVVTGAVDGISAKLNAENEAADADDSAAASTSRSSSGATSSAGAKTSSTASRSTAKKSTSGGSKSGGSKSGGSSAAKKSASGSSKSTSGTAKKSSTGSTTSGSR